MVSRSCYLFCNASETKTKFAITDTKLYAPVVTLSTQDNEKLLQQSKSGFKRTFNWKNYQSKVSIQAPDRYLDFWIDPNFQGVNRLFTFLFENKDDQTVHTKYYLTTVEMKDVMIDRKIVIDQPVKSSMRTYNNIKKNCNRSKRWLHKWLFAGL